MKKRYARILALFLGLALSTATAGWAGVEDCLILLDDSQDQLAWVDRQDGSVFRTRALPASADGPFKALDADENGNVFVLQDVDATQEGRVVFYKEADDTFQTLGQFAGAVAQWLDIEWAGNDRVLILNQHVTDGAQADSSRLYLLSVADYSRDDNPVAELGTLLEPSESDASEVFRIAYADQGSIQGVWCLEDDGSPSPGDQNPHTAGSGEDVFFFEIANWTGTAGNQVPSGANRSDAGAFGEYSNRSDVADIAVDSQGNLLLLEQDNAVTETSYYGHNIADDLYRLPAAYDAGVVSLGTEKLVAEWPHSHAQPEGVTEIRFIAADPGSGLVYGLDMDDDGTTIGIYSSDRSFSATGLAFPGTADMTVVATSQATYTPVPGGTLSTDTTWSGNLLVQGDIRIPSYLTLTISAGTRVRFAAGSDDQAGGTYTDRPELIVENMGGLDIQGTVAEPVVLTSSLSPAAQGDWGGIRSEFVSASQSVSIANCVVEGAQTGYSHDQNGGSGTLNLTNARFDSNANDGLYALVHGSGHLTVNLTSSAGAPENRKSGAASNGGYGVYARVNDNQSVLDVAIDEAVFENNVRSGALLFGNDQGTLDFDVRNTFAAGHSNGNDWDYGNGLGAYNYYRCTIDGVFENNILHDNRQGIQCYNSYGDRRRKHRPDRQRRRRQHRARDLLLSSLRIRRDRHVPRQPGPRLGQPRDRGLQVQLQQFRCVASVF